MCISNNNDLGEEIHFQDPPKKKKKKKKKEIPFTNVCLVAAYLLGPSHK